MLEQLPGFIIYVYPAGLATMTYEEVGRAPTFKVVLLGDPGVGKTSLFWRIRENQFPLDRSSTLGIDTCIRRVTVDQREIQVTLWDTAGAEKFRTLTKNFFRNAQAVLLVFSFDEPASLTYLSRWDRDAKEYAPTALRFLIGNKIDLERLVSQDAVQNFAAVYQCECLFLTSAKTGHGIADILGTVARHLLDSYEKSNHEQNNSWMENSVYVNQGDYKLQDSTGCC